MIEIGTSATTNPRLSSYLPVHSSRVDKPWTGVDKVRTASSVFKSYVVAW